jgi:hypothetical protein
VEVPDASAAQGGLQREEFFIEHLHVFSPESLALSMKKAGWNPSLLSSLIEPSGKFTIFGFGLSG